MEALCLQQWAGAEVLTDFIFPWSDLPAPATIFRALWDDENFYFRYVVEDADVVMAEGVDAKEKVMGSDRVEIFFTPSDDLDPYYALEMDPRGEVLSYEARFHRRLNWSWACPSLKLYPALTDSGYDVEGVIPLATLRELACLHQNERGLFLKAGLFRAEFSHGEGDDPVVEDWISWVDPGGEVPDFHVLSAFGVLEFEGG